MKTWLIIVIVVIIIAVGGVLYFVLFNGANMSGSDANIGVGTPVTSVPQAYPNAPTGQSISVGTSQGTVEINNPYTMSGVQIGDDGVLLVKQTPNYWITYDPSDSSFWIAVSSTPFAAIRATVEQDFVAILGVSQADACKLDVSVGVPYSAGNPMNGKSFPLSFCPTSQ
jgi:hypothetical protein